VRARGTPGAQAARPRGLWLADPPLIEEGTGRSQAADREAAELARRIEATVAGAAQGLKTGPASAADQLRAHREEMEEASRRREEERDLPGAATLGLELAVGALRLVRAVATAPVRLGLAFLRRG
jgi:hypothetical protein